MIEEITITVPSKETKRVILVDDMVVFIMKDGSVQHCKATNHLLSSISLTSPMIASAKIDG